MSSGDIAAAAPLAQEVLARRAAEDAARLAAAEKAAAEKAGADDASTNAAAADGEAAEKPAPAKPAKPDQDGIERLVLAVEAFKAGDYAAAKAGLEFKTGEPFLDSMAHLLRAWAIEGAAGPLAGLKALEPVDGEEIFTGFHATHRALMAEKAGLGQVAAEAHKASVFGLGGPIGRAAYGAFLERAGDRTATENYYRLIANQAGPDQRMAAMGLDRVKRGVATAAYRDVPPSQGAAFGLYSYAAFMLEQFAEQRDQADAAGYNVGAPRYNFPLALSQLAIYLDPDLAEARRLAGLIYSIYEDYDAAASVLRPIPSSSPQFEQSRIEIANGLSRSGREADAVALLRATLPKLDDPLEMRFLLATILGSMEDYDGAIKELSRVIDGVGETPSNRAWLYYVSRGDAYLKAKRWSEAEADLRAAVDLAPEEPTALNYLGYVWAERGVNLDEAFKLIQKAVDAEGNSGAIIDSLGWAYYQTGDYDNAVIHLERAAQLEPADPTITDHLGDVYWRLNRKREAGYQWRRVMELEPTPKQASAVEEKLENGLPPAAATD